VSDPSFSPNVPATPESGGKAGGAFVPPPQPWTATQWVIVVIACIGFAYDTYALLIMPLAGPPALAELLPADRLTDEGGKRIAFWNSVVTFASAVSGGVFGLLGGWLTDRFGRRRVLTWSILLYAVSALATGFATSLWMFILLRCTTFIGVCVEFVAAVAWLAELFPNPKQRETVLGYTQAFSSFGGLMVSGVFLLLNQVAAYLPAIHGDAQQSLWRYTFISGVIPALPLILVRPFLPESPVWKQKREQGTLRRPSLGELFRPQFRRTSLVTAVLFACGFAVAFGALQLTPQMTPGLFPDIGKEIGGLRKQYEAAKDEKNLAQLKKQAEAAQAKAQDAPEEERQKASQSAAVARKQYDRALAASTDEEEFKKLKIELEGKRREMEGQVGGVQLLQEIGGLVGRFALAFLALRIVSRRLLFRCFIVPALLLIPLVYLFPAAGNLPQFNVEALKVGIFVAGFLTIGQLSFWGNYLPRMYPTHLRGTGESFAANVGGRMVGSSGQLFTTSLQSVILAILPALANNVSLAYAAAAVALVACLLGTVLSWLLPEPKEEIAQE
jgi:MFS family permease